MKYKYRYTEVYNGIRIDVRANTKPDLREKVAKRKAAIDSANQRLTNLTVREWCFEWLETYKRPSVSNAWYKELQSRVSALCDELGHYYLKNITLSDLRKYINRYEGKSEKYIRTNLSVVKEIFHDAYFADLIPRDPSEKLIAPQGKRMQARTPLSPHEAEVFLLAAPTNDLYLSLLFMYYCALRPGEAVVLTWGDIDLDNGLVSVTKALKKDGTIGEPKHGSFRTIPIESVLLDTLRPLKGKPKEYIAKRGKIGRTTFTEHHTKDTMKQRLGLLRKEMQKIHDESGSTEPFNASDFNFYRLRHTACTNWEQKGVPINVAKVLMGHKDIQMTSKIYTHFTDETLRLAQEIIG